MESIYLNVYGTIFNITSNTKTLTENIRRDFEHFHIRGIDESHFVIRANIAPIPPLQLPKTSLWMITPKFRCYEHKKIKEVFYPSHGKIIYNYGNNTAEIFSLEEGKLHSLTYFLMRSLMGEYLEAKGYHRVHALGISTGKGGGLIIAPVRGGKTTMALELLKKDPLKLISEDTPLVTQALEIYPFPIRMGIRPGTRMDLPEHLLRDFKGISPKSDPKKLIDISFFGDKVERNPVRLRWIMIMNLPKMTGQKCTISAAGKTQILKTLIKYLVAGKGVCQGKEYFIKKDIKDMVTKGAFLGRRLKVALRIASSVPSFQLNLGMDTAENAHRICRFLEKKAYL